MYLESWTTDVYSCDSICHVELSGGKCDVTGHC